MKFIQFCENTTVTKDGKVVMIKEGIDHIEALPIDEFLHAVEHLSDFIASEKLDGANMIFGFNEDDKFYTSREAKRGGRFYNVEDWEDKAAWNGFKSAHAALQKVAPLLRTVLKKGDAVESEILFGRQPNAIVYGSSYIAFLRMVVGDNKEQPDQGKIKRLTKIMEGEVVSATTTHITTADGVKLKNDSIDHTWRFTSTSFIDAHHFKKVNIDTELTDLRKYLSGLNPAGKMGLTNGEIMLVKLNSVPKTLRDEVKQAREEVIASVERQYKLPIKEKLLDNIIRKLAPSLRDVEIHSHEDTGIEGAVFLNPKTLKQFKIVDKDVFTIINRFNFAVREQIKNTGVGAPRVHGNASLGGEGDIFGNMLQNIAKVFDAPELGQYTKISRVIGQFAGANSTETVHNFAQQLSVRNPQAVKTGIVKALRDGLKKLDEALLKYNGEWRTYRLKLQSGREISYTDEIGQRTLLVFAEVRQEMEEMIQLVNQSQTIEDIITALYGNFIKKISH